MHVIACCIDNGSFQLTNLLFGDAQAGLVTYTIVGSLDSDLLIRCMR